MSNYKWLLDAGHGGVDSKGHYTTAPSKMYKYPEFTIYEGQINRFITQLIFDSLESKGISVALISEGVLDTSLERRVEIANAVHSKHKNCIYLSIHSNAGGGSGFEIFTSRGKTKSDNVAEIFCDVYKKNFPNYPFRQDFSDGDGDKEADYVVLKKTNCPAVLFENLFFDNRKEAEYLMSKEGQKKISETIVEGILLIEKFKPV